MTREEKINMLAQRIVNSEKITTMQGAVEYVLKYADEHPDWHTMDELPALDHTMASRGFNMSLPVLLCDIDNLTAYGGARYHYDPARYNFDKKQWEDIIGYCDEEIGITHTHWMYQPEPPKGGGE